MRLVTWNCCRGRAEAKLPLLATLNPSIAVVQECGRPSDDNHSCLWFGDRPRQGVAILGSSEYRIEPIKPRRAPRYHLPIQVTGPRSFFLLAVWSVKNPKYPYVKSLIRSVELYRKVIRAQPTVIIGDFNSNAIWNRKREGTRDHRALVTMLSKLGLVSAYHHFFGEEQGSETRPTFYLLWKENRPYHIDFCFIPESWTADIRSVSVGSYADWSASSDHRPLVVELSEPAA
ncbi:MAG TPA: hypothetical protein VGA84_09010 [Thermoanaerobaculia bacterium]